MSEIYVNAAWSGKNDGDSVTVEGKTYTIGTDAFASVAKAISSVADLDGKTIAFADDSSVTPAAPFTTTYVTIDTRYATAGNIDGKTVTFTGNSNVSEVLWFDLNYKLPEADAQETVLKFENAYVYMTKIRPDYNSSVIVSGSTLDYSQGGQNGNIYAANTGVVTIQNNSKVLSLGQLSAYGTVNVDQSELHACSANGVKGSLNVTNGSTFTLSGIAIGSGGSVTIDNSTMVRKAVLTAFDDGNQSVLDWTANRELPRYRVNIGAYAGSAITGTGTMTVKNGATFDFSSAFAAAEYKNVDGANTSAAFVTVSDGSKLVIDGRDDAGKNNKVTFNVDQLINLGDVDVSGAVLLKIGSLDGRMTVNNTTFTDGTVIKNTDTDGGFIDVVGTAGFEGNIVLEAELVNTGTVNVCNAVLKADKVTTDNGRFLVSGDVTMTIGTQSGYVQAIDTELGVNLSDSEIGNMWVNGTFATVSNSTFNGNFYGWGNVTFTDNVTINGHYYMQNDNTNSGCQLNIGTSKNAAKVSLQQLGVVNETNIIGSELTYTYAYIRDVLNITDGSSVTNASYNTFMAGNAVVTVDNSTWNLGSSNSTIGSYDNWAGYYGNADVSLKNNALLTAANLSLDQSENYVVSMKISDSMVKTSGYFKISAGAELILNECAVVDITGAFTNNGTITVDVTDDWSGTQKKVSVKNDLTNANILNILNGTEIVFEGKLINNGTVSISGEAAVTIATLDSAADASSTMTVNGIDAAMTIGEVTANFTGLNFELTSKQLSAVRAGESRTLLTVTGSGNAPEMTFTVDGAALTANADGTFSSGDYVFKFDALGTDGIANDLVLVNTAPPITLSAGSTDLGGFETIAAAVAVMNADTANTAPYTITLHGTTTETQTGTLYFEKDLIISGVGTITASPQWFIGNANDRSDGVKVATNLTLTDGADLKITYHTTDAATLQGRHDRGGDAGKASTLTLNNARISGPADMFWQGAITITGSGNKDADGNVIYGFKGENDTAYTANISLSQNLSSQSRYPVLQGNVGLDLSNGAWLNVAGFYRISEDEPSVYNIADSKLVVGQEVDLQKSGNVFNISGQSVVMVNNLGFNDACTNISAGTATINVTGMDSEISFGQISSAVTAINFTLTSTEIFSAGMGEVGDNVELFKLNNADAALDAATVLSITIDGAAYTLGDEIADDAGNKYVINWGALGDDGVANDLVATMTEKAPEPVIPEEPGASSEPSQKVYINPYYSKDTLAYFSDVVGEELVLGKNAFTSVAAAKKALGANADIEYCTSDWNSSFSGSSQLEGIAKISNNSGSMGFNYGNFVSRYNMANGALNLNKVTADTDFENFAMVNVSGSNLSGAIENNSFAFSGTGTGNNASGTAWFAQGGMVNISGSTVGEVTGYAYATLNGSDVDVLSNNNILFANVKLENGEISSISHAVTMSNGMAQINNSVVGLLENYAHATMQNSDVVEAANVTTLQSMGGANSIGSFTSDGAYSQIINGYGSSLTLGDVTMNGSFDSIVNYGGTLVLTGNLKGVETLYGYGDLVASEEQIKQLGGAEKVKQTYFGDIVDLGDTAEGFSGKAAELADNTEAKAVIWDAAAEGGLRGWLGIGSDVDVKDSVDYVKFTAAADGTLDITSSAWSSTGDKVSINGTDLAITDGAVSFGVTAGTEYLVKIERKDNNSMSYDMTLA